MIEIESGTLFGGRYEIIKCLGSGGMGVVYLARDPRYQDFLVAIKVLYQNAISSPQTRDRFRTEIVASYRVNHRNIVRAYEYFDEKEVQAYAMEYVEGSDLKEKMQDGPLDSKESISILKQVASGLEAVHSEGILHRDLKPENIMITSRGVVKIADFGVARLKGELTSITSSGVMVGTPKYISPEYIETGECDHRGDIYALGVIGYEMLAGSSPFRSETRVSVLLERFKSRPVPLHKVAPDCPKELAQMIEKAMCFSINKRYQTAGELREDLECLEQGKPLRHISIDEFVTEPDAEIPAETVEPEPEIASQQPQVVENQLSAEAAPESSRISMIVSIFSIFLIIMALAASGYFIFRHKLFSALTLNSLDQGTYIGSAVGLTKEDGQSSMRIIKTAKGLEMQIDGENCVLASSSSSSIFRCAGFVYEINLDLVRDRHLAGTVKELSTGVSGTWMATQIGRVNR